MVGLVVILIVAVIVLLVLARTVRIVPQARARVVERLGRYHRTLNPGLSLVIPFIDRLRPLIDLREQVVSFKPQPVITEDNLVVSIDSVIYFQVTDAKAATYEIQSYLQGVEQLTVTTLRNVVGSLDLEETLTSRDQINGQLRGVLDEATGKWGIRVNRVELKSIDPPASVQGAMEQQMRAERDRRATILTAEGVKQSQILTAEGEKQAAILRAEGDAQSQILRAEGEARAILQVFDAIHEGDADPKLLAYQYLQMLPQIANGSASKLWVVPTEFTAALGSIAKGFGGVPGLAGGGVPGASSAEDAEAAEASAEARRERERDRVRFGTPSLTDPAEALAEARRQAEAATADATSAGTRSGLPFDPQTERGQHPGGEHRATSPEPGSAAPRPLGGPSQYAPPPPPVQDAPVPDEPSGEEPPSGGPPPSFPP